LGAEKHRINSGSYLVTTGCRPVGTDMRIGVLFFEQQPIFWQMGCGRMHLHRFEKLVHFVDMVKSGYVSLAHPSQWKDRYESTFLNSGHFRQKTNG
jgi:hypothetical protein